MKPRRDWTRARAKVDAASGCRVCGKAGGLEAAHVIGRRRDFMEPLRDVHKHWIPGEVAPDRIVALCKLHHDQYDGRRLDLLPFLTIPEQAQAVADAGGIAQAYDRTAPTDSHRRVRGADPAPMPGDDRSI